MNDHHVLLVPNLRMPHVRSFDEDCHRIVAKKNRSRFSTACVVRMPLPERCERDATCQKRPFILTFLSFVPSLSGQMSVSHQKAASQKNGLGGAPVGIGYVSVNVTASTDAFGSISV